ncbi:unnamed protein product [Rangifer tarandus platyrhynchus]|uniref:Uncharacterized protein n=1 Tax=Rangifer tarandus platyrhynchus TaxID=3082113 RepID=A0ABN8YPA5_RANTA|nr:unnamed protein product [Rangifer tarandus platyrhynchus]
MPGIGTRRQKAASPAGGEARSQSRRPSGKEARRTRGWEGRGFKIRLTDEKLLEKGRFFQDLPETGPTDWQAGPSLHGTVVGTLGFRHSPHSPPPPFLQRASNPSQPRASAEVRQEPARTFRVSVTLVLDFRLQNRKRRNVGGV